MPWVYDPTHSVIAFDNKHLGIARVMGWFKSADVTLHIDEEDPIRSSVQAVIDAASIDTGNERRDDTLRGDIYLDVARFPTIEFRSTRVERRGERYAIIGDLTLHGVTREVVLDAVYNGEVVDQRGTVRRGLSASTAIRRSDFDVSTTLVEGILMAAEEVELSIEVEAGKRDQ